jgi:protein-S-isoprenylcysteine O-methyltransferase Ste14
MNSLTKVTLLVVVLAAFAAAVLLGFEPTISQGITGALLLAVGLTAIVFAHHLAAAQEIIMKKVSVQRSTVRPLTMKIWGCGVAIIGVLMLTGFLK